MNVRQIEAFQAVMTSGSVTRAAERLGISQPAVSQLIAQFERTCGFRLFERQGNKINATREAEALSVEVQRMFVGVGQIGRVAAALREQNWGAVRLAAVPVLARRTLPELLWNFCADNPDMRLQLESMRSRSLIDAVAAHQVDFALSVLPGDRPEVVSTHLHRLRTVCILPAGHPLAARGLVLAADLANQDFISLGPQDHSRMLIDRVFDENNLPRRSRIEAGQSETVFSFVALNAGVAVVDPISAYNNEDKRIVVRPFAPSVEMDIWLLRPKTSRPFNLVDRFIDHTLDRLATFIALVNAASTIGGSPQAAASG